MSNGSIQRNAYTRISEAVGRSLEINEVMIEFNTITERLELGLSDLFRRVGPLLSSPRPQAASEPSKGYDSNLACDIKNNVNRLNQMQGMLEEILERIEI